MRQNETFVLGEGDAWFQRNKVKGANTGQVSRDPVICGASRLFLAPNNILEIGCANGWRLAELAQRYGANCTGIDPSQTAISEALDSNPAHTFHVGTAESLPLDDSSIDLLIFGFCLYLTDPCDHFRIVYEADRVLKDGGILCVYDFAPGRPYRNAYSHKPGIYSHKMDFAELFLAHPSYRRLERAYSEHQKPFSFNQDEAVAADFLKKNCADAFPDKP